MRIENVSIWAVRQKTSHVGREVILVGIGEETGREATRRKHSSAATSRWKNARPAFFVCTTLSDSASSLKNFTLSSVHVQIFRFDPPGKQGDGSNINNEYQDLRLFSLAVCRTATRKITSHERKA